MREAIKRERVNGIEVMVICLFPCEQIRLCVFSFRSINKKDGVQRCSLGELSGETSRHCEAAFGRREERTAEIRSTLTTAQIFPFPRLQPGRSITPRWTFYL